MIVIRYANDTIVGFQREYEAKASPGDLRDQTCTFDLVLHGRPTSPRVRSRSSSQKSCAHACGATDRQDTNIEGVIAIVHVHEKVCFERRSPSARRRAAPVPPGDADANDLGVSRSACFKEQLDPARLVPLTGTHAANACAALLVSWV